MADTFRDAQQFLAALASMAEELRLAIIPLDELERARLVTRLVTDHHMVFGVWPDADQPDGVGFQVIKGEGVMPPLDGFELAEQVTVAAIPCAGLEQAIAARDAWGRVHDEELEAPSSAKAALAIAEVARLVWIAAELPDAGEHS